MIVRLNKNIRSYYAAPHTFTKQSPKQEVSTKLGKYLLSTGYFEEIKEAKEEIEEKVRVEDTDGDINVEEEASKQKKLYDKSQEEVKKKSTKKEDK